jgi:hypothetical protein
MMNEESNMSKTEKLEYAVEIVVANIGKGTPSDWQHAFALARQAMNRMRSIVKRPLDSSPAAAGFAPGLAEGDVRLGCKARRAGCDLGRLLGCQRGLRSSWRLRSRFASLNRRPTLERRPPFSHKRLRWRRRTSPASPLRLVVGSPVLRVATLAGWWRGCGGLRFNNFLWREFLRKLFNHFFIFLVSPCHRVTVAWHFLFQPISTIAFAELPVPSLFSLFLYFIVNSEKGMTP